MIDVKKVLSADNYYNLLSGKNGWRIPSYNGDLMNVEPQDYYKVYDMLIDGYDSKLVPDIDKKFNAALQQMAGVGDLIDIYCASCYLDIQLNRKKDGKSIIPVNSKSILFNMKNNLSTQIESLKNNKQWLGGNREDGLYGHFSDLNDKLLDNGYQEIIDKSK